MADPLDDFVDAYRATNDPPPATASAGRERLMRAVHRRHAQRRAAAVLAVVGALTLTNATTWAWSTGRLEGVAALLAPSGVEPTPRAETSAIDRRRTDGRDDAPPEPAVDPVVATDRIDPSSPPSAIVASDLGTAESPTTRAVANADAPRVARVASSEGEPGIVSPGERGATVTDPTTDPLFDALAELERPPDGAELALFQTAHGLHFAGDYARAIDGWNDYMRVYPTGRFAPEVRFNRAVALIHLGRVDEARTALVPLASTAGGPQQAAAQRLLRAIDEGRIRVP